MIHHSQSEALAQRLGQVWKLSLPAILAQITSIAMQYIDSAMVGALGANASASIGLVSTSTWLLSSVAYAVSAGFSVQVAHQVGAGQYRDARNVVRHGLVCALGISGLLALLGTLISGPVPRWLGGAPEIIPDASAYFLVFALALPFLQLNSLTASFLQCSGDLLIPSILNAVMCVLDVLFNSIFIPMYGVLGAGIGTGLACAVVSLIMSWFCCVHSPVLRITRREVFSPDFHIIRRALRIGSPVAVQEIASCAAMVVSTMILAPLGSVAIAANSFAVTAEALCYMPGYGIGTAATTLVGKSAGAGDYPLARQYANICIGFGAAVMAVTALAMYFLCPWIFRLLTPDPSVQQLSVAVLRIELMAEPLYAVSIVAAAALRGVEDTLVPGILNLLCIWGVRLGLSLLLAESLGLHGIWIAMAADLSVRGLLLLFRQKTSPFYRIPG